ncbi:MAG: ASCH domain-containing protein [Planctomycetota bacterium]
MRNMSFALTTGQLLDGSKTVTRRLGWGFLKAGDRVCAVEKAMGLKKGEKLKRLGVIEVVSVRRERLDAIDQEDVVAEGFPKMSPAGFVSMFGKAMGCGPGEEVTRIEFDLVEKI